MSDSASKHQMSNDQVSILYSLRPGCVVDMTVTLMPSLCKTVAKKALKEVKKAIALPGFRKGHVPDELVSKHFGKELSQQLEKELAITAFNEGTTLLKKHPFSQMGLRTLSVRKYSKDTGSEVHVEFEASPEIPQIDISSLSIEQVTPKQPTESEVDDFILRLKYLFSEKKPITDRPVQIGDEIHFEITKPLDENRLTERLFCHSNLMPAWLLKGVIGMNLNEEKEIATEAEGANDSSSRTIVKITQIEECLIPDSEDPAFLGKFGVSSATQLHEAAKARLEYEANLEAKAKMRRQLRNELIRLYAFDLPQTLVEQETQARFKDFLTTSEGKNIDKESSRKLFLDEVKRQLTCTLLLEPYFNKVRSRANPAEVQKELWHQIGEVPQTQRVVHSSLKQDQMVERLWSVTLSHHAEDWIIEQRLGLEQAQLEEGERTATHESDCDTAT